MTPGKGDGTVTTDEVQCGADKVKLLDTRDHCGACDHRCGTQLCQGAVCIPDLVAPQPPVLNENMALLGEADGRLYWVLQLGRIVRRALTDGGLNEVIVTDAGNFTRAGVTSQFLYLPQGYPPTLVYPASGGAPVATAQRVDEYIGSFAAGPNQVYYTARANPSAVRSMGPDASVEDIVSAEPEAVAVATDQKNVYWLNRSTDAGTAEAGPGNLRSINLASNNLQRSGPLDRPSALAIDDTWAYVWDDGAKELRRFDKQNPTGSGERLATWTGPESVGVSLVANGAYLYALLLQQGTSAGIIIRVPKCGGAPLVLAPNTRTSGLIVVDDAWVYWPDQGATPGILRTAK